MFLACLRKELLLNLKSMRFLLTSLLLIGAIIGTTAVRAHIYRQQLEDYQQAQVEWLRVRQNACDAMVSFGLGAMVERPPNPMAVFVGGIENEMSRSVRFYHHIHDGEQEPLSGRRRLNSPAFRQFIYPDAAMLIALIGSLFALVLIFDAVCGERERGTLRLLLAGPLPRDTLLLAKITAGLVTLIVPLGIAWLGSAAYALLQAKILLDADQLGRLLSIALLSVVFVCLFFALGMVASTVARRSATALGVAVLTWIVLALIIPNAVPVLVAHYAPLPPPSRVSMERAAISREVWEDELDGLVEQVMEETGEKGWNALWDAGLGRLRDETVARAQEQFEHRHHAMIKHQTRLTQAVSRLSPVASFVNCAAGLAGTGIEDYHRYVADIDAYRRAYQRTRNDFEGQAKKMAKGTKTWWGEEPMPPSAWPSFEPTQRDLGQRLGVCWLDIVLLTGLTIVALLVAYARFLRYDAR